MVEAGSRKGRVQRYGCDEGTEDAEDAEGTKSTRQPGAWSTRKGDSCRLALVPRVSKKVSTKVPLGYPVPTNLFQVNH